MAPLDYKKELISSTILHQQKDYGVDSFLITYWFEEFVT